MSIFEKYYSDEELFDRYLENKGAGVDVIVPLINTNELWKKNLYSFYREIPINRLLVGDGGCTDNSIDIAKEFPRVEVLDQSRYTSQGYCIAELIDNVDTKWFIYLHADVYLPENWYDKMNDHKDEFDWFECKRRMTTLVEYTENRQHNRERAYSGSQMGKKGAFENVIEIIDDDYLQRNEDIIFAELIEEEGFSYGKVENTFHYHQVMDREGSMEPDFKRVSIEKYNDPEWEKKIVEMQVKGIIKYLSPKDYLIGIVQNYTHQILSNNYIEWTEYIDWVRETDSNWVRPVQRAKRIYQIKSLYSKTLSKVKSFIKKVIP